MTALRLLAVLNVHGPAIGLFGGLIMMWAPGFPGNISHGAAPGSVESPVDSGVALGR